MLILISITTPCLVREILPQLNKDTPHGCRLNSSGYSVSSQNPITADGGKEHPVNPAGTDYRCRADPRVDRTPFSSVHLISPVHLKWLAFQSPPTAKR